MVEGGGEDGVDEGGELRRRERREGGDDESGLFVHYSLLTG